LEQQLLCLVAVDLPSSFGLLGPSRVNLVGTASFRSQKLIMQILVNTDNHIDGGAELTAKVESAVEAAVHHLQDRITRVEVHLTDEAGEKDRDNDMRCVMEARLAGLQPITVTASSSSIGQAIAEAADKLEKTLRRTVDRLGHTKGRTSFAGDQMI